jgi:hypothetical protein
MTEVIAGQNLATGRQVCQGFSSPGLSFSTW